MLTEDEQEMVVRILNNAALAKAVLEKGDVIKALHYIDSALSWAKPLVGVKHPAFETDSSKLLVIENGSVAKAPE